MLESFVTPTDALLPHPLIESLQDWAEEEAGGAPVTGVSFAQHSNDVAEMRLADGRRLMVKRGRYDWVARRFENARAASELIRSRAGLEAPEPLDVPPELDDRPLEAYWRIELPTLSQTWPALGERERRTALESCGAMLARLHRVPVRRWGSLEGDSRHATFEAYLQADLWERLIPAVWGEWPDASGTVEALAAHVPALAERLDGRTPVLVHGDVHMGNILCDPEHGPACMGMLDLESAAGGVIESDLAIAEVLHGPHFTQPLPDGWLDPFMRGYDDDPDPLALAFFRAYHTANLGFFSALVGDVEHAGLVLTQLRREVDALGAA